MPKKAPEQQAREMLDRMGIDGAATMTIEDAIREGTMRFDFAREINFPDIEIPKIDIEEIEIPKIEIEKPRHS